MSHMKKQPVEEILEPEKGSAQAEHVQSEFWSAVKRAANRIPFMDEVVAAYYCAMDPDTPLRVRGILLAAIAYFIMPFDTVPDFLMLFGFGDDIAVLTAAITSVRSEIKESHRRAARDALREV
jgi:uncharacterized membrane protein YkvA (DUF1232 family)